jgi:hypothetical protein
MFRAEEEDEKDVETNRNNFCVALLAYPSNLKTKEVTLPDYTESHPRRKYSTMKLSDCVLCSA